MTLDEIAERTGFAKSYISQIETMKREPPISTLTRIASALNVDVFFLISGVTQGRDEQHLTVARASERSSISDPLGVSKSTCEPINDRKPDRVMDGYIITIGMEFPAPSSHEGQELAFMLEGSQEFVYDGKSYLFEKGDCFYFDSDRPHYGKSLGDSPAKVLVVLSMTK